MYWPSMVKRMKSVGLRNFEEESMEQGTIVKKMGEKLLLLDGVYIYSGGHFKSILLGYVGRHSNEKRRLTRLRGGVYGAGHPAILQGGNKQPGSTTSDNGW